MASVNTATTQIAHLPSKPVHPLSSAHFATPSPQHRQSIFPHFHFSLTVCKRVYRHVAATYTSNWQRHDQWGSRKTQIEGVVGFPPKIELWLANIIMKISVLSTTSNEAHTTYRHHPTTLDSKTLSKWKYRVFPNWAKENFHQQSSKQAIKTILKRWQK